MLDRIFGFLDSNFLQTVVTLAVGLVALYVYQRQRKDTKRAAANSIFLEIQHTEHCLPKIKEAVRRGTLQNLDFNVLREDSWSKYSHLFSNDFDKEEWEIITDFYTNARLLDESIIQTNRSIEEDIKQIRINKQRILANITKDTIYAAGNTDGEAIVTQYNQKLDVFDKLYMSRQDDFAYTPVKYLNDAKKCLEDLDKISITSIGTKFKKIIGIQ
jgi:hypothetical protein